jgi:archaellum biogenesis ATPase FlaH
MSTVETQSAEFDALEALAKTYKETIQSVAIVDDFYPEARFNYERALQNFFEKCQANGRFEPGSRFGMKLAGMR